MTIMLLYLQVMVTMTMLDWMDDDVGLLQDGDDDDALLQDGDDDVGLFAI